jgi:hypothetical protein
MNNRPASVNTTFLLIALNAILWLAFSILVSAGLHPAIPAAPLVKWGMAILALLCSAALLGLLVLLAYRRRSAYFLMVSLLVLVSVATIADDFGLADLAVLIVTVVPLVLLVKDRIWYLQTPHTP